MSIEFERLDVEQDPEAEQTIRDLFDGELKFPVLIICESILKNPTIQELNRSLHEAELL